MAAISRTRASSGTPKPEAWAAGFSMDLNFTYQKDNGATNQAVVLLNVVQPSPVPPSVQLTAQPATLYSGYPGTYEYQVDAAADVDVTLKIGLLPQTAGALSGTVTSILFNGNPLAFQVDNSGIGGTIALVTIPNLLVPAGPSALAITLEPTLQGGFSADALSVRGDFEVAGGAAASIVAGPTQVLEPPVVPTLNIVEAEVHLTESTPNLAGQFYYDVLFTQPFSGTAVIRLFSDPPGAIMPVGGQDFIIDVQTGFSGDILPSIYKEPGSDGAFAEATVDVSYPTPWNVFWYTIPAQWNPNAGVSAACLTTQVDTGIGPVFSRETYRIPVCGPVANCDALNAATGCFSGF